MILNVFSDAHGIYVNDECYEEVMKKLAIDSNSHPDTSSTQCMINEMRDLMKIVAHYQARGYTHVKEGSCDPFGVGDEEMVTCNEFIERAQDSIDAVYSMHNVKTATTYSDMSPEEAAPDIKPATAYSDMSPETAKKLRETVAKKIEYQRKFDAPESPPRLYHGSQNKIDKFEVRPHYLAEDEPVVFGTPSRTLAISFLAPWQTQFFGAPDFEQSTYNNDPTLHMTEQYPGALEKVYKGRKGYMYELDPSNFEWGPQLMRSEFISKEVPEVLNSEELDVYEAMLAEEAAGRLKIHRAKETPTKKLKERAMILQIYSDGLRETLINVDPVYDHDDDTDNFLDIDDIMSSLGMNRSGRPDAHRFRSQLAPQGAIDEMRDLIKIVSHYKTEGYTHVDVWNDYNGVMMTCDEFIAATQENIDQSHRDMIGKLFEKRKNKLLK